MSRSVSFTCIFKCLGNEVYDKNRASEIANKHTQQMERGWHQLADMFQSPCLCGFPACCRARHASVGPITNPLRNVIRVSDLSNNNQHAQTQFFKCSKAKFAHLCNCRETFFPPAQLQCMILLLTLPFNRRWVPHRALLFSHSPPHTHTNTHHAVCSPDIGKDLGLLPKDVSAWGRPEVMQSLTPARYTWFRKCSAPFIAMRPVLFNMLLLYFAVFAKTGTSFFSSLLCCDRPALPGP